MLLIMLLMLIPGSSCSCCPAAYYLILPVLVVPIHGGDLFEPLSDIEHWKSGELIDLWTEVINSSQSQPGLRRGKKASASSRRSSNAHRALRAVTDGHIKKLFIFLPLRVSLQLMMQSLMRCFRSILKPLHYLPP